MLWLSRFQKRLIHLYSIWSVALCGPAAVSVAVADGELPGQCRAEAGQMAALCCQTPSPQSTLGGPEPHLTQRVRLPAAKTLHHIADSHFMNLGDKLECNVLIFSWSWSHNFPTSVTVGVVNPSWNWVYLDLTLCISSKFCHLIFFSQAVNLA